MPEAILPIRLRGSSFSTTVNKKRGREHTFRKLSFRASFC